VSDSLVDWLCLQLDEDERVARAAQGMERDVFDGTGVIVMHATTGTRSVTLSSAVATHIARWDPARVLREVEAKRKILNGLLSLPHYLWQGREEYGCPKVVDADTWREVYGEAEQVCDCGRDAHVDQSLRLLALPYSDPSWLQGGVA
jgi:hypothetical protein